MADKNRVAVMLCDDGFVHVFKEDNPFEAATAICGRTATAVRSPDDENEVCEHCAPSVLTWAETGKLPD